MPSRAIRDSAGASGRPQGLGPASAASAAVAIDTTQPASVCANAIE